MSAGTQEFSGAKILAKLSASECPLETVFLRGVIEDLQGAVLALLLAELKPNREENYVLQFELLTAAYVHSRRRGSERAHVRIIKAYKVLPPELFGQQLEYLHDLLSNHNHSEGLQRDLIRLSVMLTKIAPEGKF